MNILIMSDFNIAGQCTMLKDAINKYTSNKARCIIAYKDYLSYGEDIILNKDNLKEAADLAMSWADFYHFGSFVFNWPGVDFNNGILTPENCVVKYYGSFLRDNGEKCRLWHELTGIKAITGTDYTITGLLPNSFYHLSSYFTKFGNMNFDNIPSCVKYSQGQTLKICASSAGHPSKGYSLLQQVIGELQKEGYLIELDLIQGVSNEECLLRKQKCHVNFCSLHGGWGISGVESMFMGQPTMTCLDPFILSMYPNQPSILVNGFILKDKIKEFFDESKAGMWYQLSQRSIDFANENFRWKHMIKKYMYVIDLIYNNKKYLQGGKLPEVIYE